MRALVPLLSALVVVLVAVPAGPASAHDQLVSSSPAAGSTVDAPPDQVVLEFTGDLLDISQDVIVTTPSGDQLTGLDVSVDGRRAVAALPDGLGFGAYTVTWRVVSGDGHPIEGRFGFTVTGPGPHPSPGTTTQVTTPVTTPAASPDPAPSGAPSTAGSSPGTSPLAVTVAVASLVLVLVAAALTLSRRRRRP